MRRGCYNDFMSYKGRKMSLRLKEEPRHRQNWSSVELKNITSRGAVAKSPQRTYRSRVRSPAGRIGAHTVSFNWTEHILYECTKYHSLRDKLRERALVEGGVVWLPPVDFWMRKECRRDFAAYVGRVLRLRADEHNLVCTTEL